MSHYIYIVQMDIPAHLDDEFNRIYDQEHIPYLKQVAGVRNVTRYRLESTHGKEIPRYCAIYEIDSPQVVNSPTWLKQSDEGEWSTKIRPYATNISRSVFRLIS